MEPCLNCGKMPGQHEPSTNKCLFDATFYRAPVPALPSLEMLAPRSWNNVTNQSCCERCGMAGPSNNSGSQSHTKDMCIKALGEQVSRLMAILRATGSHLNTA